MEFESIVSFSAQAPAPAAAGAPSFLKRQLPGHYSSDREWWKEYNRWVKSSSITVGHRALDHLLPLDIELVIDEPEQEPEVYEKVYVSIRMQVREVVAHRR